MSNDNIDMAAHSDENLPEMKGDFKGVTTVTERVDMDALRIIRDNWEEIWERLGKKVKIQGKNSEYKMVKDCK